MNITPYISMDACAGNVTDVCKIGQELSEISRNVLFFINGKIPALYVFVVTYLEPWR